MGSVEDNKDIGMLCKYVVYAEIVLGSEISGTLIYLQMLIDFLH